MQYVSNSWSSFSSYSHRGSPSSFSSMVRSQQLAENVPPFWDSRLHSSRKAAMCSSVICLLIGHCSLWLFGLAICFPDMVLLQDGGWLLIFLVAILW